MDLFSKLCDFCGKEFMGSSRQRWCSPECRKKAIVEYDRIYRKTHPKKKKKSGRKMVTGIENVLKASRAANMSYGEYKAQETIERFCRIDVDAVLREIGVKNGKRNDL